MKFYKKNKALSHGIILSVIYILFIIIITRSEFVFGSTLDWCSQHYPFPDYFRKLFYDTGNLFPNFAPHCGAGENIYSLSYYGLFSPMLLLSYLFPFIEMSDFVQIFSIISMWASIILFYNFVRRRFKPTTAFIGGILFLFSAPLFFHSHRHIMFVNYMPFLIAALEAADMFIKKNIKFPLIIFTALIIFSSYFFSIPSIIAITIYGIFSFISSSKNFSLKDFVKTGVRFTGCIAVSVSIAAILLLPTFAAILGSRDATNANLSAAVLIPFSSLGAISLSPHAFGLSSFGLFSVIAAIYLRKSKADRFLGITMAVILLCPVVMCMLNGGMYVEGKALIPFTPIVIFLSLKAYEELRDSISDMGHFTGCFIIFAAVSALIIAVYNKAYDLADNVSVILFLTDTAISSVFIILYVIKKRRKYLACCVTVSTVLFTTVSNFADTLMTPELINYEQSQISRSMLDIISSEDNIVRSSTAVRKADTPNIIYNTDYYSPYIYSSLHNKYYNDFYFHKIRCENEYRNSALTTRSANILFNIFIGNKYLSTKKPLVETGYKQILHEGNFYFYENEYALPIGRSSKEIISREQFDSLSRPEQMEALVKCFVTEGGGSSGKFHSTCRPYEGITLPADSRITCSKDRYTIDCSTEFKCSLDLETPLPKDKILIITMNADNRQEGCDERIKINHCKNTLTDPNWKYCNNNTDFTYVLTTDGKEELDRLDFIFSPGKYSVENIQAYTIDYPSQVDLTGEFKADKSLSKGDVITGEIECSDNGFFLLTVPYSEGFEITVDGKPQDYELTSCAFIGFPIEKGHHNITLVYTAPMEKISLVISAAGLAVLIFIFFFSDFRKIKKLRKSEYR